MAGEMKEFLMLRYSLIEEEQQSSIAERVPTPKGRAIVRAIESDREFVSGRAKYGFVGFRQVHPTLRDDFAQERFYVGKTAKLKQVHRGTKVPGDIIETTEDDWVPLLTVIDTETQHIIVRKDWRFGNPEQTIRIIQDGLRDPILAHYNHRVFVEGKTKVKHFWSVVESHRKIYNLEIKLISPNILETNRSARDALAALKDLFRQDELAIRLRSEAGDLSVPKAPLDSYLEYIEEGEGTWSVTTEGVSGGKKKHSSSDSIDVLLLPVPETPGEEDGQMQLGEFESPIQRLSYEAALVAMVLDEVRPSRER